MYTEAIGGFTWALPFGFILVGEFWGIPTYNMQLSAGIALFQRPHYLRSITDVPDGTFSRARYWELHDKVEKFRD